MLSPAILDNYNPLDLAIGRFFDAWWKIKRCQIRNIVLRYVNGDIDAAEDITQNVSLRVWGHLHQWRGGNFDAWVYRIAVHESLQYLRKQKRERIFVSLEDIMDALEDEDADPMDLLLKKERQETIHRSVAALPVGSRDALQLDLEGLAIREIAEILGVLELTVKSRLRYARQRLGSQDDFDDCINHFMGPSRTQMLEHIAHVWWDSRYYADPVGALLALREMMNPFRDYIDPFALMFVSSSSFSLRSKSSILGTDA